MPEEEKALILTPADQRRKRRSGAFVFGLFLIGVVAVLATTVLAVNNGRNYLRIVQRFGLEDYLLPAALPPPNLRIDRQKQLPPAEHYPPWLLYAKIERPAVFEAAVTLPASERCSLLKAENSPAPTFTSSAKEWECLFFEEFGSASERASLFIQAKGVGTDMVRILRIKFNLIDPQVEQAAIDEAIAATQRFGLPMTPETRVYLADRLSARKPFVSIVENYKMTFSREITDERRYNLQIFPLAQTIACGDPPQEPPGKWNTPIYRMPVSCLGLRSTRSQPSS